MENHRRFLRTALIITCVAVVMIPASFFLPDLIPDKSNIFSKWLRILYPFTLLVLMAGVIWLALNLIRYWYLLAQNGLKQRYELDRMQWEKEHSAELLRNSSAKTEEGLRNQDFFRLIGLSKTKTSDTETTEQKKDEKTSIRKNTNEKEEVDEKKFLILWQEYNQAFRGNDPDTH
ncbi:MAG: hypothetical protein JW861_13540 [Bacteroidales bacterium]|nr:hypothetical protein [Bacteroidales bacterium]